MTVARIAVLILQLSVILVVFTLGLESTFRDALSLFRRPALLFRSLVSMNVVMPVFAAFMAATFHLKPAVEIALVFLAVSPVPPIVPRQQLKLGGNSNYVHGLLVSAALASIILVPIIVEILGKVFRQDIHVGPVTVAKIVAMTILLPIAAGMWVHRAAPKFAQKAAPHLSRAALVLLLVLSVVVLVVLLPGIAIMVGDGTILAVAAFVLVGAAVGHWLGGPMPGERTTLALATASRHPGLALAIASVNYPGQRRNVAAVIVLYFLVKAIVLLPYTRWRKRQLRAGDSGQGVSVKQRVA